MLNTCYIHFLFVRRFSLSCFRIPANPVQGQWTFDLGPQTFNSMTSSARQNVERPTGHIKGRFRRLRDIYSHSVKEISKLFMSACVLHNLCIVCDDDLAEFFEEDIRNNAAINNYPNIYPNHAAGVRKRNNLIEYLQQFN